MAKHTSLLFWLFFFFLNRHNKSGHKISWFCKEMVSANIWYHGFKVLALLSASSSTPNTWMSDYFIPGEDYLDWQLLSLKWRVIPNRS